MADPTRKTTWNRQHYVYAEKHKIFQVLQETLKELLIWKPEDPLLYIRDEIRRVAKTIDTPRAFLLGPPEVCKEVGKILAKRAGCKFLTIQKVVDSSPPSVRKHVAAVLTNPETSESCLRELFIAAIQRRISLEDCSSGGYILYGFPQCRSQAVCAQQNGLLPRQIFILYPQSGSENLEDESMETLLHMKSTKSQLSVTEMSKGKEYFILKDIASIYASELKCEIEFNGWESKNLNAIADVFFKSLSFATPSSVPWIPKIVIFGPPAAGKTTLSEYIHAKFGIPTFDWVDMIRGAVRLKDSTVSEQCKAYLNNLTPLPLSTVEKIIRSKVDRPDCEKMGWLIQNFPENMDHARLLDAIGASPNRIYFINLPEELSIHRMTRKRKIIAARRIGQEDNEQPQNTELNESLLYFPYTDMAVRLRYRRFRDNLNEVLDHYGPTTIYIDGTMKPPEIRQVVENSILRTPLSRYNSEAERRSVFMRNTKTSLLEDVELTKQHAKYFNYT